MYVWLFGLLGGWAVSMNRWSVGVLVGRSFSGSVRPLVGGRSVGRWDSELVGGWIGSGWVDALVDRWVGVSVGV